MDPQSQHGAEMGRASLELGLASLDSGRVVLPLRHTADQPSPTSQDCGRAMLSSAAPPPMPKPKVARRQCQSAPVIAPRLGDPMGIWSPTASPRSPWESLRPLEDTWNKPCKNRFRSLLAQLAEEHERALRSRGGAEEPPTAREKRPLRSTSRQDLDGGSMWEYDEKDQRGQQEASEIPGSVVVGDSAQSSSKRDGSFICSPGGDETPPSRIMPAEVSLRQACAGAASPCTTGTTFACSVSGTETRTGRREYHLRGLWTQKAVHPSASTVDLVDLSLNAARVSVRSNMIESVDFVLPNMHDGFLARFISAPTSKYRLAWELLAALLVLWDMIVIPLQVFNSATSTGTTAMDWVTLLFWTAYMLMSPFAGYVDKGTTVMHPRKIMANYARSWLIIDLVVVIPDWVFTVLSLRSEGEASNGKRYVSLLRILRLSRTIRLLRLFRLKWIWALLNDMLNTESASIMLHIACMIVFLLLINHFTCCIWYAIADINMESLPTWISEHGFQNDSWEYMYMTSFHFSITQFTPASMHVQPQNIIERMYTISLIVFGLLGFSYLVGSITGSLSQLRSMNEEGTKEFWNLRKFLRQNDVPTGLSMRVQKYLEHAWDAHKSSKEVTDVKVIRLLSEPLYNELAYTMTAPHMEVHPLFRHLKENAPVTMHRLATKAIVRQHIAWGDFLFVAQEVATHMYFVQSGRLEYTRARRGKAVGVPRRMSENVEAKEDWICEHILWVPDWKHLGTLTSISHSVLLLVDASVFGEAIQLNSAVFSLVQGYGAQFVAWLNSTDLGDQSDIIQGEEMAEEFEGFVSAGVSREESRPVLMRNKTGRKLKTQTTRSSWDSWASRWS